MPAVLSTLRHLYPPMLAADSGLVVFFGPDVGIGMLMTEGPVSRMRPMDFCFFRIFQGPWAPTLVGCYRYQVTLRPTCRTWEVRICSVCADVQRKGVPLLEARFRACSKCYAVYYCSEECQLLDWPVHKIRCGRRPRAHSI